MMLFVLFTVFFCAARQCNHHHRPILHIGVDRGKTIRKKGSTSTHTGRKGLPTDIGVDRGETVRKRVSKYTHTWEEGIAHGYRSGSWRNGTKKGKQVHTHLGRKGLPTDIGVDRGEIIRKTLYKHHTCGELP